jgi:hypothetical protein
MFCIRTFRKVTLTSHLNDFGRPEAGLLNTHVGLAAQQSVTKLRAILVTPTAVAKREIMFYNKASGEFCSWNKTCFQMKLVI